MKKREKAYRTQQHENKEHGDNIAMITLQSH